MTKNILVSGASIAGPALAYWLREHGYTVTVVERSPGPRSGGYKIDVRGRAMEVLTRMGIVDEVRKHHTDMRGGAFLDRRGRTVAEMDADTVGFREPTDVEILRGDLARILRAATEGVEYLYGDSIMSLTEDAQDVAVTFERSLPRRFDLVIGADGLHSAVRALAFGPEERFLRSLGHHIAIFSVPNLLELDRWETIQAEKGRTLNVYSTRQNTEAKAAFMFASPGAEYGRRDTARQQEILTEVFASHGWIAPQLLDAMPAAPDFYFDGLSVVEMESWSAGRVALVGDAAYCPSPASGQGTSLALVGAYVLAGELASGFGMAILVGVLCVYFVLTLLFKDFLQPVTILSAISLSLGGAFIALLAAHSELGGRYQEAIREFSLAIQDNPTFALSYAWRGRAYSIIGQFAQAKAVVGIQVNDHPVWRIQRVDGSCICKPRQQQTLPAAFEFENG